MGPDAVPPPPTPGEGVPDTPPGLGEVSAFRAYYRAHRLPTGYSRGLHLTVHLAPLAAGCVWACTRLHQVTLLQWLVVPVGVVLSSLFVYWFHRDMLHRPRRFFYYGYRNHTLQHHRFYDHAHMTPDGPSDMHITLFPAFAGPVLLATTLGLAWLLRPLIGGNLAALLVLVANGYMLTYETVHSIGHLPDGHPLSRLPVLRFLREHHRLHHDPALMGKYNFNIVLPLFDWLFGAFVRRRP